MQCIFWLLCLGLAKALGAIPKDQVAQHVLKLYRTRGAPHSQSWVPNNCKRLVGLIHQKSVAVKKLSIAAKAVERDQTLSDDERLFRVMSLLQNLCSLYLDIFLTYTLS